MAFFNVQRSTLGMEGYSEKVNPVVNPTTKIFLKLEVSPFIRRLLRKRKGDVDRRKLEST